MVAVLITVQPWVEERVGEGGEQSPARRIQAGAREGEAHNVDGVLQDLLTLLVVGLAVALGQALRGREG
jgi:hypothetical protein